MSQGGLTIVLIIILPIISILGYILATRFIFGRDSSDPDRTNTNPIGTNRPQPASGMEEYERQVILDLLRDQLKYSQEDYSALQGEVKALRVQVADLKNAIGRIDNRLDNYRLILSHIEENTRK